MTAKKEGKVMDKFKLAAIPGGTWWELVQDLSPDSKNAWKVLWKLRMAVKHSA